MNTGIFFSTYDFLVFHDYCAIITIRDRNDNSSFCFTVVACHAKRKKLTRKTKKTLLNTTFKSVFYYL